MVRCMDRGIDHNLSHPKRSLRLARTSIPRNVQLHGLPRFRIPLLKQASTNLLTNKKYDALVLSGGGIKGIAMLGSMAYLTDAKLLDNARFFIGTSVGAIVATVIAMGLSPKEIFKRHVMTFKYSPDIDITSLERNFGLDSGKNLEKWIAAIVPEALTFKSFSETYKKSLIICATNLNTHAAEYFSETTTPDLSVRLALRMSCSVPLYFAAVKYNGHLYVDGGVASNFPVQHAIDLGAKKIIGVRFASPDKEQDYAWSLESFLGALFESNTNRKHPSCATVLKLCTGTITQPLNFKLNQNEKRSLYESGYRQAQLYFKKHQ